jgi:hypothetical protein
MKTDTDMRAVQRRKHQWNYWEYVMKKVFWCLFFVFFGVGCFAQELKSSQVRINNTVFTLGVNKYETDYDLVFNKWYQGHLSSTDVKRGDSLDWVNQFTGAYSITVDSYDVSINNVSAGQDLHGILFSGVGKILFIYDTNGVLSFVHLNRAADAGFKPVKLFDILKMLSSPDYFVPLKEYVFLQDGILTEPAQDLTGLVGIQISSLTGTLLTETKSAYDWVVSYETRTGKAPDSADSFTGLKYELSAVRIEKDRQEKERLEREALAKLEQERKAEADRIACEQQEKERLKWEALAKLERERRAEEERAAREQEEQERLERQQQELKKLEQEMLAKKQLEEWRNSLAELTGVIILIVNNGKEEQTIIVGKTTKTDALYMLKTAFSAQGGQFIVNDNTYSGAGDYSMIRKGEYGDIHITIFFKGNIVDQIKVHKPVAGGGNWKFEKDMYGILTVIPPDIIKLW